MALTDQTKSIFNTAPLCPPDSIFGLIEEFKLDPNPYKINLSVGVYQDESGRTPVMNCVRAAEKVLFDEGGTKNYLPIDGSAKFNDMVGKLALGNAAENPQVHWKTAQTPGGTVALRIAGDTLRRVFGTPTIWISNPTWANHPQIYQAAGYKIQQYSYLDSSNTRLDFQKLCDSLDSAKPGQAILLHTVCHNPTGVDPSPDQWIALLHLIREKELLPIFDFAYQGFGVDLHNDSFPVRQFVEHGGEALICSSFSKNFGLYAERVGGVTVAAQSESAAKAMHSQVSATIRTIYSNPPLHGGKIVETILGNADLRKQWERELTEIRERILRLREQFVTTMSALVPQRDFQYILEQRGMFSYSGLTADQVARLKKDFAIYALSSGRINVAGINQGNLMPLCKAIANVIG
jgi:aspartate/tyrosine/aromatic aminotransferase